MLKIKLTKAEHEALSPALQSEYKADGDSFVIDTDVPFEDTKALKNALAQEKEARKQATQKVTTLEEEKKTLEVRAGNAGDLEKSWQDKLAKAENAAAEKAKVLTGQISTLLVDNVAQSLAAEISVSPDLMIPHLKSRLAVAEEDGKMLTRVLTADGKASALSVNELKAEIVADTRFAPIIKGSSASGGGAQGGKAPAGGKAFKEMNESERVALYRADPAKFRTLSGQAATPAA